MLYFFACDHWSSIECSQFGCRSKLVLLWVYWLVRYKQPVRFRKPGLAGFVILGGAGAEASNRSASSSRQSSSETVPSRIMSRARLIDSILSSTRRCPLRSIASRAGRARLLISPSSGGLEGSDGRSPLSRAPTACYAKSPRARDPMRRPRPPGDPSPVGSFEALSMAISTGFSRAVGSNARRAGT